MTSAPATTRTRPLSTFASSAGCACKIPQFDLSAILSKLPAGPADPDLLVGNAEIRVPLVGAFTGEYRYGALPIDAFAFADTGVAWTSHIDPSFAGGSRDFVSSVGGGIRANVFGYAVLELAAVKPLSRPGQGWMFAFNIGPGF